MKASPETVDYNKDWLKKWLRREPHITLGDPHDPYLKRWYVIPRNKRFNLYLHKFCKSDEDRALHDHPWDFWSFILKGGYTEHTADGSVRRPWLSLAHRRAEHAHRVELDTRGTGICGAEFEDYECTCEEKPAWTLFFTTAKRREWGFHCPKGWVHWEKFTAGPRGEESVGCGEYA